MKESIPMTLANVNLEILQRFYKLLILGTLVMTGHTHQTW